MSQIAWEYNGKQYPCDLQDADMMERFEMAVAAMRQTEKDLPKEGKGSEIMRAQCGMFRQFFDAVFGDGTFSGIVQSVANLRECWDAYESFLAYVDTQATETMERRGALAARYSPNRAARRAQQKAK